jgi:hypothetical protein
MEMPRPGAPQQQLAKLAGNWSGEEKLFPSPWDPVGGKAMGKAANRVGLDGWVVVQDYEQTRDGVVSFKGHGVFSFDAAKGCVVLQWYDSMAGGPFVYTGTWTGDVLTLTGASGGGHGRCTFDVGGGGYKFAMDVSQDGKQWAPFMSGSYRKS